MKTLTQYIYESASEYVLNISEIESGKLRDVQKFNEIIKAVKDNKQEISVSVTLGKYNNAEFTFKPAGSNLSELTWKLPTDVASQLDKVDAYKEEKLPAGDAIKKMHLITTKIKSKLFS